MSPSFSAGRTERQKFGLFRCRRGRAAISRVVPFGDVLGGCIARGGSVGEVCGMQAALWEEGGAICPLRAGFSEGPRRRATFFGAMRFCGAAGERRRGSLSR